MNKSFQFSNPSLTALCALVVVGLTPAANAQTRPGGKPAPKMVTRKNTGKKVVSAPKAKITSKAAVNAKSKKTTVSAANAKKTAQAGRKGLVTGKPSPVGQPLFAVGPNGMPRGSYLTSPAHSGDKLFREAYFNPQIRARYERIWGLSPQDTLRRLQALNLINMPTAKVYKVYYARPNGAWGYKVRNVPQGTLAFAYPNTKEPVMLQVCGNPVEAVAQPKTLREKMQITQFSPHESDTGLVLEEVGETGDLLAFTPQSPEFSGGGEGTSSADSGALIASGGSRDASGDNILPVIPSTPVGGGLGTPSGLAGISGLPSGLPSVSPSSGGTGGIPGAIASGVAALPAAGLVNGGNNGNNGGNGIVPPSGNNGNNGTGNLGNNGTTNGTNTTANGGTNSGNNGTTNGVTTNGGNNGSNLSNLGNLGNNGTNLGNNGLTGNNVGNNGTITLDAPPEVPEPSEWLFGGVALTWVGGALLAGRRKQRRATNLKA